MLRRTSGNRLRAWVGGPSLLPETQALIARFTTPPTTARSILINDLIAALIAAGAWAKLDALYVMAAADSQAARQNWIANQYNLTAVSSPTFTTDRGYTTNGSSSYLNTNLPVASATLYTQNSAHLGIWSRTAGQMTGVDIGARVANGDDQAAMLIRAGLDNFNARINVDATPSDLASTDGSGHFVGVRPDASNVFGYRNGAQVGATISAASAPRPAFNLVIGAINSSNTISAFNARQYAAGHVGAALSAGETASLYTALLTYMQAVGAA